MALFGLFKKKEVPKPVETKTEIKMAGYESSFATENVLSGRHEDDLEKPTPIIKGPLFPDIPKLELPEIMAPEESKEDKKVEVAEEGVSKKIEELNIPELEIGKVEIPKLEKKVEEKEVPETIPELEIHDFKFTKTKIEDNYLSSKHEIIIPDSLPAIESFEYKPKKQKPVFIDLNKYNEIVTQLNQMKMKINDYAMFSTKMSEIKNEKERAMEKYRHALEEIERKLLYVD
ncbi:MAG: hypothetical protein QXG86_03045, partial [Candidatus Woesearchaeota archaeon]